MYRTIRTYIRKGHRLFGYCKQMTLDSVKLYNRANYVVRQYATAMDSFSTFRPLFQNQMEVYDLVGKVTAGSMYAPTGKWLNYNSLDYILKTTSDAAYYSLPAQANQQILKLLFRDYQSFFGSIREYHIHPDRFKGRPKLPGYFKLGAYKTSILTNQICNIKDGHFLKFPGTKTRLNLGSNFFGKVKEVRIVPENGIFVVETVVSTEDIGLILPEDTTKYNADLLEELSGLEDIRSLRVISIDPGVDNLCAITNNFHDQPVLIKGTELKSANRYYNKRLAELKSLAERCNKKKSTARIQRLTCKRNCIVTDTLHKISRYITNYCTERQVDLVIIGHNNGQKQNINIGDANNQNFVQLPFEKLTRMLRYKLAQAGIRLVVTEESYTSKADYLAGDEIPVYVREDGDTQTFSGCRIKRGLYRHFDGTVSNADINGSANIMRKVFPKVTQWDRGVVNTPCAVYVA